MLNLRLFLLKCIFLTLLSLLPLSGNNNAFAQASKPKDFSKIQVKALNNVMTLRDLAKCDVAFGMQESVENGYVSREASEKWHRFIRVIVLESEQSKNFSGSDFYLAKDWFDVGGDPKHFAQLDRIVTNCSKTLEPFVESNKLYNDIFVNRSLDYLAQFRKVSPTTGINLSLVDFQRCQGIMATLMSNMMRSSKNFDGQSRINDLLHYIANVQKRRLIEEMKYTRIQLWIAQLLIDEIGIDYSNINLDDEAKKCAISLKGAVSKELSVLLSQSIDTDKTRNSVRFFQKDECVYVQKNDFVQLNDNGSIGYTLNVQVEYYFSKIDKIFHADTKDLSQYTALGDAIVRNLARNTPNAIFLLSDKSDISNTNSLFRSNISKSADSEVRNKKARFAYFLFDSSDKSSEVKPMLQVLALSCQI